MSFLAKFQSKILLFNESKPILMRKEGLREKNFLTCMKLCDVNPFYPMDAASAFANLKARVHINFWIIQLNQIGKDEQS